MHYTYRTVQVDVIYVFQKWNHKGKLHQPIYYLMEVKNVRNFRKKIGMTQIFEDGKFVPVTVVEVEPNYVYKRKQKKKKGTQQYN